MEVMGRIINIFKLMEAKIILKKDHGIKSEKKRIIEE